MEENKAIKTDEKGRFLPGTAPGPGRPKGTISPITRIKQIFEENPETFESFVTEYMADQNNRKHLVEMLDGKPKQDIKMEGDLTVNVVSYGNNPTL